MMDDFIDGVVFLRDLPTQCALDGRPWEDVGPDDVFLCEIVDLDDDPCFARFCEVIRRRH